jgi:hypothetical protein
LWLIGCISTLIRSRWGVAALLLPVAMIFLVSLIAPLAIEEERDASER